MYETLREQIRAKVEDKELANKVRTFSEGVEEYISNLKPKEYKDGWPEDKWQEEMVKHPFFMNELNPEEELPPLAEAIQELKYNPEYNTPVELAQAYKTDGNDLFNKRQYQYAELAYTEGLNKKCEDTELNAVLYTNRAAAHYYMGHFKKALEDATTAKELNPLYAKAYFRGAQSYLKLDKFEDCISWCDEGLKLKANNEEFLDLKKKAILQMERKKLSKEAAAKKMQELEALNNAIRDRGINLVEKGLTLESLECNYCNSMAKVHLTVEGVLMWPVLLLYPEYNSTDFIQAFDEDLCFFDYFVEYFAEPSSWDINKEYSPENLNIYFSDSNGNIVPVDEMQPLKSAMTNKRFMVTTGTLTFILTSSQFDKKYRSLNTVVEV